MMLDSRPPTMRLVLFPSPFTVGLRSPYFAMGRGTSQRVPALNTTPLAHVSRAVQDPR